MSWRCVVPAGSCTVTAPSSSLSATITLTLTKHISHDAPKHASNPCSSLTTGCCSSSFSHLLFTPFPISWDEIASRPAAPALFVHSVSCGYLFSCREKSLIPALHIIFLFTPRGLSFNSLLHNLWVNSPPCRHLSLPWNWNFELVSINHRLTIWLWKQINHIIHHCFWVWLHFSCSHKDTYI